MPDSATCSTTTSYDWTVLGAEACRHKDLTPSLTGGADAGVQRGQGWRAPQSANPVAQERPCQQSRPPSRNASHLVRDRFLNWGGVGDMVEEKKHAKPPKHFPHLADEDQFPQHREWKDLVKRKMIRSECRAVQGLCGFLCTADLRAPSARERQRAPPTSTTTKLFESLPPAPFAQAEVSLHDQTPFDDRHEFYDPQPGPQPQRQQPNPTPLSQPRPPSSQSSGARSLRRTSRLQERKIGTPILPSPPGSKRREDAPVDQVVLFDESGSTTPRHFRQLVQTESDPFWPPRSSHLSRRTQDAILFALEAIRKGSGVNAKPLTADLLEEEARMSDLVRGTQPVTSGRSQNGAASRIAASAAGPTPADPPRYRTPTDVMRERRLREARRAEEAARQRQQEEERRQQEEQVVGVGDDPSRRRQQPSTSQTRPTTQTYNISGPPQTGPSSQAGQSARRQESQPPSQAGPSRTSPQQVQPQGDPRLSANTQRNRTEAYDTLNIPAPAKPAVPGPGPQPVRQPQPPPPQSQGAPQPATQPQPQPRSRFPNAFERWEDLSSQWEGIVGSFIHRLQNNADELAGKPIDRQMARQVEDLSAAGANLFHAVVELQRLRASSERKFQRWFFETRHEQEQAAERQAELERQLRVEREARTQSSTSIEAVRAEKSRAEDLVKEMRRELQISKEEARRAWEELGRREQEERERTIALRSGEPTLIGGVQVVPMQGLPSRQVSMAQRPPTRDGPTAAAGPTTMSGQYQTQRPPSRPETGTSLDSPEAEARQFTFQSEPEHSPTVSDPFIESPHQALHHQPDTQFYTTTPPRPPIPGPQPLSSATAPPSASARTVTSGSRQPQSTQPYYPPPTTAPMSPTRSYIPSTASAASEEEYHINPDGSYTRDAHGRRIPYNQPIIAEEYEGSDEGDDDHAADAEREAMNAAQYRQQLHPAPPVSSSTGYGYVPHTTSGALPTIPQGSQPEYEGQEYGEQGTGWEGISTQTRHRHPTRLSDIIEEQTARTSPSRTSYVSGGASGAENYPPITTAGGSGSGGYVGGRR